MQITVRLFASFREVVGRDQLQVDVAPETAVGDLLAALARDYPRLAAASKATRFAVNQEYVPASHPLQAGDEVVFIPPVAGGGDVRDHD